MIDSLFNIVLKYSVQNQIYSKNLPISILFNYINLKKKLCLICQDKYKIIFEGKYIDYCSIECFFKHCGCPINDCMSIYHNNNIDSHIVGTNARVYKINTVRNETNQIRYILTCGEVYCENNNLLIQTYITSQSAIFFFKQQWNMLERRKKNMTPFIARQELYYEYSSFFLFDFIYYIRIDQFVRIQVPKQQLLM